MAIIVCVWALTLLQLSGCLSQENPPTVAEYFLEAMDLLGRENWRYFLPNYTDIDQDGRLSDLEIQIKFNHYLEKLFEIMDQKRDRIVTEEEMSNLEITGFTDKVIDIAMENFPVKPVLLAADANGDGFYDEDDFYLPAKLLWDRPESDSLSTKVRLEEVEGGLPVPRYLVEEGYFAPLLVVGDSDGTVLCKSLGFEGLDDIGPGSDEIGYYAYGKFSCQGNEIRLEDCQLIKLNDTTVYHNSVNCKGEQKLGSLNLVGGKDSSAGDIFFGEKGLGCAPEGRELDHLSEVICRELGFPGFVKTTRRSAFTSNIYPKYQVLKTGFSCTGTEPNIRACKRTLQDQNCDDSLIRGIVCKTDTRKGVDDVLDEMVGWNKNSDPTWETFGRILFIADSNADGKLTHDELAATAKTYVSGILEFLDQTQDGHVSISDVTTLNLKVEPIHKVLNLAFDVFADKSNGDIDLLRPNISGIDPFLVYEFYQPFKYEKNDDNKLNALDLYYDRAVRGMSSSKMSWRYLIPILNLKLDKNQDGKIQRQELNQFIDDMFKRFDDDGNGEITLKDVTRLMRKNGFDCFQVGVFNTYVTILFNEVKTQFEKLMSYIFEQFDLDGNKGVTLEEFEKMDVPCHIGRRRSGEADDSRLSCSETFTGFFGAFSKIRFPYLDQIFLDQHGRRIKWKGVDEEYEVDKLANAACEIITEIID